MDNSILRKASRHIWSKRNKIKTWSVLDLVNAAPSINKEIAIQTFKILKSDGLMQYSFSINNNTGAHTDLFTINLNKEKEWKHEISCLRFFDSPVLKITKFCTKYWMWLISLIISTILAIIAICK